MSLERELQAFLSAEENRKTSLGKQPARTPARPGFEKGTTGTSSVLEAVGQPMDDTHWSQNIFGNFLWSAMDEASLGALGFADEYEWLGEEGDKYLEQARTGLTGQEKQTGIDPETGKEIEFYGGPENFAGKLASGAGTVAGFIAGAPAKVGLKGINWLTKTATAKMMGRETREAAFKKIGTDVAAIKGMDDVGAKVYGRSIHNNLGEVVSKAHKPGKLNSADAYKEAIETSLKTSIDDGVKSGLINAKIGDQLSEVYLKYLKDRPITSVTDYFTEVMTNKKLAYGIGSIINEGFMFGVLDATREGLHVAISDGEHKYDLDHPKWGVVVGGLFGALKWLPSAGKSSQGKLDFYSALRGKLANHKNIIANSSYANVRHQSTLLAADLRPLGMNIQNFKYKGKKYRFDLSKPESEAIRILDDLNISVTDNAKKEIVGRVFEKTANQVGNDLLKWTTKNSWANIKDNWPKMVLGGAAMNARGFYDMMNGVETSGEDLAVNFILGAALNRKGLARRQDMFPEQMQRLRRQLHTMNLLPPKYITTNPIGRIPTLDPAISSNLNPFASDPILNSFVQRAENLGLTTNSFDALSTPIERPVGNRPGVFKMEIGGEKSVTQSTERLDLFHHFYRFLQGASAKKYTKSLDSISEKTAKEFNDLLLKEYGDITKFSNHLRKVADTVGEKFETEIVKSALDVVEIVEGLRLKASSSDGSIGEIPNMLVIDSHFFSLARQGKLGEVIDYFKNVKPDNQESALYELRDKVDNIFKTTIELQKANKRQINQAAFLKNEDTGIARLEALARRIQSMESAINVELGLNKTANNAFSFSRVDELLGYMQNRILNKRITKFSSLFDASHPSNKEIVSLLIDAGILRSEKSELRLGLKLIESVDQIKFIDKNRKVIKDKKIVDENKIFISALLEIIGTKNQYQTTKVGDIYIDPSKIQSLKNMFNSLGINVESNLLQDFSNQIVQRVVYENFKNSQLNPEQKNVFQQFMNLGTPKEGESFSLMHWHKPGGKRATGMMVHKIEYLGTDTEIREIVNDFNNYVTEMHISGKVGLKDNVVAMGDTYTITDPSTFHVIKSVLQDAQLSANRTAVTELNAFFLSSAENVTGADAGLTFLTAYPNKASKLVRLLINTGALEVKKGDGKTEGTYKYEINQEKFNLESTQTQLRLFVEKYGINLDSLDLMVEQGKKAVESYMEDSYGLGDHKSSMPLPEFFKLYKPKDQGNVEINPTPEKMLNFLNETLYTFDMKFKGFDGIIDAFNRLSIPNGEAREAYHRLMQVVSNHIESKPKTVYFFSNGKVQSKDSHMHAYDNPYYKALDKMGIKFALVDGITYDWGFVGDSSRLRYDMFDIFQADSRIQNNYDKAIMSDRKAMFMDLLAKKTNAKGFENGIQIMEMPGMKLSLIIGKDSAVIDKIRTEFDRIYKENIDKVKGTDNETLLKTVKNNLENSTTFDPEVQQVFRAIMAESMIKGKDKSLFTDYLSMNEADLNKFLVGRQTMFNTSKFKRINSELVDAMVQAHPKLNDIIKTTTGKDIDVDGIEAAKKYSKAKEFGIGVFNDGVTNGGWSVKESFELHNKGKKWEDYYADRLNESAFDSITFISKEMADFLGFYYAAPGSKIFKPIISSQGNANLMYGKTAFVYDPKLEPFFKSNPNLDILMASSADKLKVAGDKMIEVAKNDLYKMGKINDANIIKVPLNSIGVQKIPDYHAPSKIAPSIINNHTDIDLAQRLYNDYFAPQLGENLKTIRSTMNNPFIENELLRTIKDKMSKGDHEALEMLDGTDYHMSAQLEWLKLSPYASLDIFGEPTKMNIFKSKYLDTALAPTSEYTFNSKRIRFGSKSVIGQKADTDLQGTLFNNETGKIERYGEIMIPETIGEFDAVFDGRNFNVRVINTKNNEISNAKDIHKKIMKDIFADVPKEKLDATIEKSWNHMVTSGKPMQSVFDFFNTTTGADKVRYDIGISTLRYPRTRPNDLHLLRLRGFVKGSGHQSIVNSNDVYHIFEGDYDIDTVDFFWGSSDAWIENILRQQKVFVPTADVQTAKEVLPNIKLLSTNARKNNEAWSELNGNKRSIANLRGVVQATSAKVKYIDNIAATVRDSQGLPRKVLMRNNQTTEGKVGYWEIRMDWDNADFHLRQALEGQILLDASAPDPKILRTTRDWMTDFLFPKIDNSISKETFKTGDGTYNTNNLRMFLDSKNNGIGAYKDKRVRLFRKVEYIKEKGETIEREIDLNEVDIRSIKKLMSEYSKILEVMPGRKVYSQAEPKKATYEQMLNASNRYFNYLNSANFQNYMFKGLWQSQNFHPDTGEASYSLQKGPNAAILKDYFGYLPQTYNKYNKTTGQTDKIPYRYKKYSTRNPFHPDVLSKLNDISEGRAGGIAEKSLFAIKSDLFNRLHLDNKVLTNETLLRENQLVHELINNPEFDVTEMNNFMPKLLGEIKNDIDIIKRLKKQMYFVKKSRAKNKAAKLKKLKEEINEMQNKIKPLLVDEAGKWKKTKDIKNLEVVDIQSDKNYIAGTTSYFALTFARGVHGEMNNKPGYRSSVLEARKMVGKEYAYLNELHGQGYGKRSIFNTETMKVLSKTSDITDIETRIHETITRNVNEHGLTWLWDFAMPSNAHIQNYIGRYKGNVMPMAIKASGNYKRAVRWLLDAHANQLPEGFYVAHGGRYEASTFTKVLQHLAQVDFQYRQLFSGKGKNLPSDVFELNKMLAYGAPRFNWKMDNMFSKYTDIKATKHIDEFNPFGMGRRYDQQIQFFRALSNLNEKVSGQQFDQGAGVLSYTNQLMMENGYLLPQKVIALMADAHSKLDPIMSQAYPASIDIRTGEAKPLRPFDLFNNPMHVLLGGDGLTGSSISLNPYKAMSSTSRSKMKNLIRQTKDMIETNENHWETEFKEIQQPLDVLKGEC